jgi:hypothetical protein
MLIDTAMQGVECVLSFFPSEAALGGCGSSIAFATNVSPGSCSLNAIWVVAALPKSLSQVAESSSALLLAERDSGACSDHLD